MKGIGNFVTFYLKAILGIGLISFVVSLIMHALRYLDSARDLTLADILVHSILGSLVNGFILATIAILFLVLNYYWNVGKSKMRRKKRIDK